MTEAEIIVSGDLEEVRIAELGRLGGRRSTAFGVGHGTWEPAATPRS